MINDDIKPAVMMMYGKHEELVGIVKVLTSQIGYKMRGFYEVRTRRSIGHILHHQSEVFDFVVGVVERAIFMLSRHSA